jgi:hypothetical protein
LHEAACPLILAPLGGFAASETESMRFDATSATPAQTAPFGAAASLLGLLLLICP